MAEYMINYGVPNDAYYIDTSLYRGDISFYLEVPDAGYYTTNVFELSRAIQYLESDFPNWKDFTRAFVHKGLILVQELTIEIIQHSVKSAYSNGFYDFQEPRETINRQEYLTPSYQIRDTKEMPEIESVTNDSQLQREGISAKLINVHLQNARYSLMAVLCTDVQDYFNSIVEANPEEAILAVPGLVLIRSWSEVTPEEIVKYCFNQKYFDSLKPS